MYINRGSFLRTFFYAPGGRCVLMLLSEAPKKGMSVEELNKICVVSARLTQGALQASEIDLTVQSQSNFPGLVRTLSISGIQRYAYTPKWFTPMSNPTVESSHAIRVSGTVPGDLDTSMVNCLFAFDTEIDLVGCSVTSAQGNSMTYTIQNADGVFLASNVYRDDIHTFDLVPKVQEMSIKFASISATTDNCAGFYFFTTEQQQTVPTITHAVLAKSIESSGPTYFEIPLEDIEMDAPPTDGLSKSLNIRGIKVAL